MKKIAVFLIIFFLASKSYSQLNNGWIDYSKVYYKFKIGSSGLIRLTQPVLSAAGLSGTPAQNFQLWRNGVQVRIYTSVATGTLSSTDYIEFLGEMNDAKPDKTLYRDTLSQLNDKKSLFSDTASYFLTVNTFVANNLRYAQSANPVATNVLAADNYFMRRQEQYYSSQINKGWYTINGEPLYLSDFDLSEGWTSSGITPSGTLSNVFSNANVYTAGPANSVTLAISAGGNGSNYNRSLAANINGGSNLFPTNNTITDFGYQKDTLRNLPLSLLNNTSSITVNINNTYSSDASGTIDQIVVGSIAITYPATFNFNNQQNFYFELQPSAVGNYLVITNFNNNGVVPILYDVTNGNRYLGDITTAGQIKFALPASLATTRKFNLMSQDASNITNISSLSTRNFVDITSASNQANYIIISNKALYDNGSGVNNVELYRQYRSSSVGGSYNAKIYDIDELTDQFGFGISKHPTAIRDFIRYANQSFSIVPKFVFLIGRGVNYADYYTNQSSAAANQLNLLPTFGWPASDVLLACNPGSTSPLISIGRIGAVNGTEVGVYLQKMKEYEQAQQSTTQTIANKAWMKNMLCLAGSGPVDEAVRFTGYLNNYAAIANDTLLGAHTEIFTNTTNNLVQNASNARIAQLFNIGLGNFTYFGHTSSSQLLFSINNPSAFNNQGKYPFINVSGCNAGDFFIYDPTRVTGNYAISEAYTFTPQKGSIGFLADTHLGLENYLDAYNTQLFTQSCKTNYGGTIGDQIKRSIQNLVATTSPSDYYARMNFEEVTFQGDPALKINSFDKPDYDMEPQLIQINPSIVSVANTNFTVAVKMINLGKATNDSIRVTVKRILPTGTTQTIYNAIRLAVKNTDSLPTLTVPINPLTDTGLNKIIVTLDVDNKVTELSETNNTAEQDFIIYQNILTPVYPYNYAIVNQQNITFTASTANPLLQNRQYTMQLDTTALFNSPFLKTYNITGNGGAIEFKPVGLTFTDSTVYYWRTSVVPIGSDTTIWGTSSFVYLASSTAGFNQSHYFQNINDTFTNISYLSSRYFDFVNSTSNITLNTGLYPYFVDPTINVQLNNNLVDHYGCKYGSLQFYVFDKNTLTPWKNYAVSGSAGSYGSAPLCLLASDGSRGFFEYQYNSATYRKAAMDFIDLIPQGNYVLINNLGWTPNTTFITDWQADQSTLGVGNDLYHKLKNLGFTQVDSFYKNIPFMFLFRKGDNSFTPVQVVGLTADAFISKTVNLPSKLTNGKITSPLFGPAKAWSQFHYRGKSVEQISTDSINFKIMGISATGTSTTLFTLDSTKHDFDISSINAKQYPYLQLQMNTIDTINASPYQLRYWRLNYTPVAEGAIAPNILFQSKDSINQGELVNFKVAFKNISTTAFDSTMVFSFIIIDSNNVQHPIALPKGKVLVAGDTLSVQYTIDSKNFPPGNNTIYLNVNPNNAQPEQYLFNNVLYKSLYVSPYLASCLGTNKLFTTSINGTAYQWQVNTGAGFANISDNATYTGSASNSLSLSNPTGSMTGFIYRCMITTNSGVQYSAAQTLRFVNTWLGTVDNNWQNANNWGCTTVPNQYTDVIIPGGSPRYPTINVSGTIRKLQADDGSSITLPAGSNLIIIGH